MHDLKRPSCPLRADKTCLNSYRYVSWASYQAPGDLTPHVSLYVDSMWGAVCDTIMCTTCGVTCDTPCYHMQFYESPHEVTCRPIYDNIEADPCVHMGVCMQLQLYPSLHIMLWSGSSHSAPRILTSCVCIYWNLRNRRDFKKVPLCVHVCSHTTLHKYTWNIICVFMKSIGKARSRLGQLLWK